MSLWRRSMIDKEEVVPDANPEEAEKAWSERLEKQIADSKVIVAADGCSRAANDLKERP